MATVRFLENIFLGHITNSDVIEPSPFALEMVTNECIVMARESSAVVHADCMQVIRVLVHVSMCFFNLLLK